jgi:hypothetical protein
MNRLQLLYQLDDLLENCKCCEKNSYYRGVSSEVRCKGCSVYEGIRFIGENLGRKKGMAKFEMPVAEYVELSTIQKKSKREIAKIKGISEGTLYLWINKNDKEIKSLTNTPLEPRAAEAISPMIDTPKQDKTTEMRQLINDLSDTNNAKDKLIQELQIKVQELEHLNSACSDIEIETTNFRDEVLHERKAKEWAQQEYARTQKALEEKDYELENLLSKHADVYSTLIKLEKENRALKELIILYIKA